MRGSSPKTHYTGPLRVVGHQISVTYIFWTYRVPYDVCLTVLGRGVITLQEYKRQIMRDPKYEPTDITVDV